MAGSPREQAPSETLGDFPLRGYWPGPRSFVGRGLPGAAVVLRRRRPGLYSGPPFHLGPSRAPPPSPLAPSAYHRSGVGRPDGRFHHPCRHTRRVRLRGRVPRRFGGHRGPVGAAGRQHLLLCLHRRRAGPAGRRPLEGGGRRYPAATGTAGADPVPRVFPQGGGAGRHGGVRLPWLHPVQCPRAGVRCVGGRQGARHAAPLVHRGQQQLVRKLQAARHAGRVGALFLPG